jgi:hypothetical protein
LITPITRIVLAVETLRAARPELSEREAFDLVGHELGIDADLVSQAMQSIEKESP